MRIVAIGDTHLGHRELVMPPGDVLVIAGDILSTGKLLETIDVNCWLGELKYKHKILVPGNHDRCAEHDPAEFKRVMNNCTVLINESIEIDGIKFHGMPNTPAFEYWAFMYPRGSFEGRQACNNIPLDTNFLITHGPAWGTDRGYADNEDVGCHILRERIELLKNIKVHVCGHIHSGYGYSKINNVDYYNVSVMDQNYNIIHKPTEITILK